MMRVEKELRLFEEIEMDEKYKGKSSHLWLSIQESEGVEMEP